MITIREEHRALLSPGAVAALHQRWSVERPQLGDGYIKMAGGFADPADPAIQDRLEHRRWTFNDRDLVLNGLIHRRNIIIFSISISNANSMFCLWKSNNRQLRWRKIKVKG